jgi:hypothetical protein
MLYNAGSILFADLLQCEIWRGATVEKGDCTYFPSLLAEESRPSGTAQVEPMNSQSRPSE